MADTRIILLQALTGLDGTAQLFRRFIEAAPTHFSPSPLALPLEPLGYAELADRVAPTLPDGCLLAPAPDDDGARAGTTSPAAGKPDGRLGRDPPVRRITAPRSRIITLKHTFTRLSTPQSGRLSWRSLAVKEENWRNERISWLPFLPFLMCSPGDECSGTMNAVDAWANPNNPRPASLLLQRTAPVAADRATGRNQTRDSADNNE
jgi:hypothetical protein